MNSGICQHSFVEGKDDEGESNPDSKDGMPIRFMKKTFFQSGVTVVLAKAACDKGYFVAISYPDGHQTVVETDSRAKAKRIASAYRLRENPLVM